MMDHCRQNENESD